jgi:hypothetical protein
VKCNRWVILLLFVAALRTFVYNAAFPLFNNVDEQAHFDLVYKYSEGHIPTVGVENLGCAAAELIALYGTPEYLFKAEQFPEGAIPPPLWTDPNARKSSKFAETTAELQASKNHEAASFPVYYIVAGAWCRIGRALGMTGGHLPYWVRFLNVPLFTALVWVFYLFSRWVLPERPVQQIGLLLLVCFFPQDLFYSINSDVVSPLIFAVSFFMLLEIYFGDKSRLYHISAGLAVAATLLTKISNVAVLVLLCVIVLFKIRRAARDKRVREYLPRLAMLLIAAAIPAGIWLSRNCLVFGDITGTAAKTQDLGWTVKPLSKLLDHPIFTYEGMRYFLARLTKTFWRGEFVWHRERIAWRVTDWFYIASSAAFMLACGWGVIRGRDKMSQRYRFTLGMSFLVVVVSVLLLVLLSMLYDFGSCYRPSRELPYFVQGRLISCVVLPFLLIYADGLERIFRRLGWYAPVLVVVIVVIVITVSEAWLSSEVFASPYNWFHLK